MSEDIMWASLPVEIKEIAGLKLSKNESYVFPPELQAAKGVVSDEVRGMQNSGSGRSIPNRSKDEGERKR